MTALKRFTVSLVAVAVMACPGLVSYSYFLAFAAACGVPEFLGPIPLWPVFWGSIEGLALICLFAYWTTSKARVRIWGVLIACVIASMLVGLFHPLTHDPAANTQRFKFPWPWSGIGGMLPAVCWPTALWLAHLVRQADAPMPDPEGKPATVWTRLGEAAGERLIGAVAGTAPPLSDALPEALASSAREALGSAPQALLERTASAESKRPGAQAASARVPASWGKVQAATERLLSEGVEPTSAEVGKRSGLSAVRVRAIRKEMLLAETAALQPVATPTNGNHHPEEATL